MHRKWKLRIRHILEAIKRVRSYTQDMELDAFHKDTKTQEAVVRNFQVIGEAVWLVPEEIRAAHTEIPWRLMRGMRNVLVHEYDRVDLDILWDTIQISLPPLVPLLERIYREEPGE